ncbi:MAG: flagellar hook capping FlgD N-terminal domain-containing protein [Pseudomonadota bacterium]
MTTVSALNSAPIVPTETTTGQVPDLGQAEFLKLMTAQLENQDPFKPLENGEFLGQMAQFSTVSGIEQLNETMQDIGSALGGGRVSEGAALLGREVLVPGTVVRPAADGALRGSVTLDAPAEAVTVRWSDSRTFETLFETTLGPQAAGRLDVSWPDPPADVVDARSGVRVTVEPSGAVASDPRVFARVEAVTLPELEGAPLVFDVEDYGLLSETDIASIR